MKAKWLKDAYADVFADYRYKIAECEDTPLLSWLVFKHGMQSVGLFMDKRDERFQGTAWNGTTIAASGNSVAGLAPPISAIRPDWDIFQGDFFDGPAPVRSNKEFAVFLSHHKDELGSLLSTLSGHREGSAARLLKSIADKFAFACYQVLDLPGSVRLCNWMPTSSFIIGWEAGSSGHLKVWLSTNGREPYLAARTFLVGMQCNFLADHEHLDALRADDKSEVTTFLQANRERLADRIYKHLL